MTTPDYAAKLRAFLVGVARRGEPMIYREVAHAVRLPPPNTIHQLALLLEELIEEDVRNGVPLIASLVISKQRNGLPAPGFFAKAQELGLYDGANSGTEAHAFHASELTRAIDYWSEQNT